MTDHFAVLGIERRAALDADAVRERFQARGRTLHPDSDGGDARAFAALNEAQAVLSRPGARVRHLIELVWGAEAVGRVRAAGVPPALVACFAEVGAALARADALAARRSTVRSGLGRALLAGDEAEVGEGLAAAGRALLAMRRGIEARLPEIDSAIAAGIGGEDAAVEACRALSYAEKWHAQVQERMAAMF